LELDLVPGPAPRGDEREIAATFAQLRAHVSDGKTAAIVVAGKGTAQRVGERLSEAEVPYVIAEPGHRPEPGEVAVFGATLRNGIVCADAGLVVVTEADLTGTRVANVRDGRKLPAKRRNQVDPLALTAGDLVVHDQHG